MAARKKQAKLPPPEREMTAAETARHAEWLTKYHADLKARGNPRLSVSREGDGPGKLGPPDDETPVVLWQSDLSRAFGTTNLEFADRTLGQLLNGATDPASGVNERTCNEVLGSMSALAPRDELEAMLISQMIACQDAAMAALRRMRAAKEIQQHDTNGNMAVKLMRTFAAQLEALKRYRSKGEQRVTVQHVHVAADQAAVQVNGTGPGSGGVNEIREDQPHEAHELAHAPGITMRGENPTRDSVPVPRREGAEALPDARRG
jgi:hypothetical protein